MEQINTEEIMQEIQAQIQQRGYVRNELKFEDVQVETGTGEVHEQIDDYFELDQFGVTVDHMKHTYQAHPQRAVLADARRQPAVCIFQENDP